MTPQIEGFLIEKLSSGILYEDQNSWGCVKRTDFYNDYCAYIKLHNPNYADPLPDNIFGKELKRLLPECVKATTGNIRLKDRDGFKFERSNVYSFDPIEKCRMVLCDSINVSINWEEPVKEQVSVILSTDGEYDFKKNLESEKFSDGDQGLPNNEADTFVNDDEKDLFEDILENRKKTEFTLQDGTIFSF